VPVPSEIRQVHVVDHLLEHLQLVIVVTALGQDRRLFQDRFGDVDRGVDPDGEGDGVARA